MSTYPKRSLLVVDDEPHVLSSLASLLNTEFEIIPADCAEAAQRILTTRQVDLILTDLRMPGQNGIELLEWVRQHAPRTLRLLMTGFGELEDAVAAINRGQVYRYLYKPWRNDELIQVLRDAIRTQDLMRNNQQLLDQMRELNVHLEKRVLERTTKLEEMNHELKQKNQMLEKLALTDPLTGIPNRRAIDRLAEAEIRRRMRYPSSLSLALVDADHFKEINSRYLLSGGDEVLTGLARVLSASVRTVDSVGRIGGEEFMVIAPETGSDGAAVLGERIRSAVEQHRFKYKNQDITVTVCVGFAVAEAGEPAEYDLLKHVAATALGEAKSSGRNRCLVHGIPTSLV